MTTDLEKMADTLAYDYNMSPGHRAAVLNALKTATESAARECIKIADEAAKTHLPGAKYYVSMKIKEKFSL